MIESFKKMIDYKKKLKRSNMNQFKLKKMFQIKSTSTIKISKQFTTLYKNCMKLKSLSKIKKKKSKIETNRYKS